MRMEKTVFQDDYEHIDPKIIYSPENIDETCDSNLLGCECSEQCNPETCACLQRSGACYNYENRLQTCTYTIKETDQRKPVYECNNNCQCSNICGNKLVQYGPRKQLVIINCNAEPHLNKRPEFCLSYENKKGKGYGLISNQPINKGNFICEYAGEVLSQSEAKRRYHRYKSSDRNYIFCVNEHFGDNHLQTFIDPTFIGNIGRYINHSCEPNCELVLIRTSNIIPKLCIFAKTDIPKNEELTFDYAGGDSTPTSESNEDRIPCLCGKRTCRKYLPFDARLT